MSKSPFLDELTQRSSNQQNQFIQHIADRLGRPVVKDKPNHPIKGSPSFWQTYQLSQEERIQLFQENWRNVGGHTIRFDNMKEVKPFIIDKVNELGARKIIHQNQTDLNQLELGQSLTDCEIAVWEEKNKEQLLPAAASADIGIGVVDFASANTGSIVVTSSKDTGRTVSLLPAVYMAIIPVDRIYTRLGEILIQFEGRNNSDYPAGIHFITGPSRSADIENDLTIGVHGPGVVYAVLVG